MSQTSFLEPIEPAPKLEVPPGLRRYAVIRKTYPPRRNPRPPYLFLTLLENWEMKRAGLEHQAKHGGPKYELVTMIDASIKRVAAMHVREMYPGELVEESETI